MHFIEYSLIINIEQMDGHGHRWLVLCQNLLPRSRPMRTLNLSARTGEYTNERVSVRNCVCVSALFPTSGSHGRHANSKSKLVSRILIDKIGVVSAQDNVHN